MLLCELLTDRSRMSPATWVGLTGVEVPPEPVWGVPTARTEGAATG